MKLSGWGRFPVHDANVVSPRDLSMLVDCVKSGMSIARGNGRAYGDSAISLSNTVHTKHFNHMLEFDRNTGHLVVESGVVLADIIDAFMPIGWFPAVTPGTKYVTVGGMIAADVHGKNHHKDGGFGNFVNWIDLMDAAGNIVRCSSQENSELFNWTIGGMGLTGIILRASIRLRSIESAWIRQETIAAPNLDHAMESLENSGDSTYSVAWIDCQSTGDRLGRSLVMLGEHAKLSDLSGKKRTDPLNAGKKRKITVPIDFPSWILNGFTIGVFNRIYYLNGKRKTGTNLVDWDSYFYPLDALLGWNKIYGRNGFAQFQCVLPQSHSQTGLRSLLSAIVASGQGSFLAVLKKLGSQSGGISFPMPGFTLALDFPVNRKSLSLMADLDRITLNHGGRFYLAKDSRMTAKTFTQSDSRANEFAEFRRDGNFRQSFQSAQSERLEL